MDALCNSSGMDCVGVCISAIIRIEETVRVVFDGRISLLAHSVHAKDSPTWAEPKPLGKESFIRFSQGKSHRSETGNTLEDRINSSSDDFEGYASDARGEMSDTPCGNGYCCASDGRDSL